MNGPEQEFALVTGASRGLGREIARALARHNYAVTVVGRTEAALAETVRSLQGSGHTSWRLDLSDPVDTYELLRRMRDVPFRVAINNAGGTTFGPLADLPAERVEEIAWLNFTAPALISSQFLRDAPRGATLVNITSVLATIPMPGNTLYSSTKAALKALTEGLWYEQRGRGIRVLEFRPGTLRTDFHASAGAPSIRGENAGLDPARAAEQLVVLLGGAPGPSAGTGIDVRLIELLNRLLPRRLFLAMLGRRAERAGYLNLRAAASVAPATSPGPRRP